MKISEAKKMYTSQLDALWSRKRELSKLLQEESGAGTALPCFDRVELSKELSEVEARYDETSSIMEHLQQQEAFRHDAEAARQQCEAAAKALEDMAKILEIARRISSGGKVPSADEKMLMDYSHELYMAAKSMAFLNAQKERKEYDSLVEEEEPGDAVPEAAQAAAVQTDAAPSPAAEAAPAELPS